MNHRLGADRDYLSSLIPEDVDTPDALIACGRELEELLTNFEPNIYGKSTEGVAKFLVDNLKKYGDKFVTQTAISNFLNSQKTIFSTLRSADSICQLLHSFTVQKFQITNLLQNALSNWIIRQVAELSNSFVVLGDRISLKAMIDWWSSECLLLGRITYAVELEFIISLHLRQFCAKNEANARETLLLELPQIIEMENISEIVREAFVQTICYCASVLTPGEFFYTMYPTIDSLELENNIIKDPWLREIERRLIRHVLELARSPGCVSSSMIHVLSTDKTSWLLFFCYYPKLAEIVANTEKLNKQEAENWKHIQLLYQEAITLMNNDYNLILSGKCSVAQIKLFLSLDRPTINFCWEIAGKSDAMIVVDTLSMEITQLQATLHRMKICATKFLAKLSPTCQSIVNVEETWDLMTIEQIRYFMGSSECIENVSPRLDLIFILSWEWLYSLTSSQLFRIIWKENKLFDNISKIVPVSRAWKQEFENLLNKNTSFARMATIAPLLSKHKERSLLCTTALGFIELPESAVTWKIIPEDFELISLFGSLADAWLHLHAIYETIPSIIRVLECLHLFIKASGLPSLDDAKQAANTIQTTFQSEIFDKKTLSDLSRFTPNSEKLDGCLVNISAELFENIVRCVPLLDWLRELTDDKNFTNSIEAAMGKSEMECPVELWQEQKTDESGNFVGRVDEQKLSMLSTVRRYLYGLIYRKDDRLDNLQEVNKILSELRETDENVITSLCVANQYRISLRELLNGDSDNAAPDRLLQLLQEKRKCKWTCSLVRDSFVAEVWLTWVVSRLGCDDQYKKQNLNELMDFQSSVVLAKTDQQGDAIQHAIEQFVQQFGWMRILCKNLTSLLRAGHFDYQDFRISFPFSIDPLDIRSHALMLRKKLDSWNNEVQNIRKKHYFMNFYRMQHIWKLVSVLRSLSIHDNLDSFDTFHSSYSTIQDMICLVNVDFNESITIRELFQKFLKFWNESDARNRCLDAVETLKLSAECLDCILVDVPCRYREISEETSKRIYAHPTGADISKGVHMVCSETNQHIFDYILSIYARAGYLPEYEFVFVCQSDSTWEQINNLILRWSQSHCFGRENKIYCLAAIENLSFELQRRAAIGIRENIKNAKNPLIVISGSSEKQHIVAQFANYRSTIIPLPHNVLQQYSQEIKGGIMGNVRVYTSIHAGAGKTFSIRTKAAKEDSLYLPITIVNTKNVLDTILNSFSELRDFDEEVDYLTLHLDLYDTVEDSINTVLFNFIFLGGIEDIKATKQFFWNPTHCNLAIEVPAGSLIHRTSVCNLIPETQVTVTPETFCASYEDLQRGMGQDFFSIRNDGTTLSISSSIKNINAYNRLQYVCIGLNTMEITNGLFPYVSPSESSQDGKSVLKSLHESQLSLSNSIGTTCSSKLSAARCFEVLMKSLDLNPEKPSLWCIWSFINVFYWQLRDMHYPNSPINCACLPDVSDPKDVENKSLVKGEVVKFLIQTAREFATRQIRKQNSVSMKALWITGMSNRNINGLWDRMDLLHDGKPVFKKISMGYPDYLYYRNITHNWVIDDTISPSGTENCFCSRGLDFDGLWSSRPSWKDARSIKARMIKDVNGYNGEAVEISGCMDDSGSATSLENGCYLRQPPYDNINDRAHYIKQLFENDVHMRRHLFFEHGSWQICPQCNREGGVYLLGSSNITGIWKCLPAPFIEVRGRVQSITEEDFPDFDKRRRRIVTFGASIDRDRSLESNNQIRESIELESNEHEAEEETMQQLWDNTLKWNDSNHECLLFSNTTHVVSFLSLNPNKLRNNMNPRLLQHLTRNQINVGEDLDKLSPRFYEILSALTEVQKTSPDAQEIMEGQYCLTGDSLLKMLAIFARLRCGVPVVLMGECGCGKTMLIKYLCLWINVELEILDVHGGTSESEILKVFHIAESRLQQGESKVFVFLDEINTCAHMGLFCEIICHRTIYGKRLSDEIYVLAALNPYRSRPEHEEGAGLVFQLESLHTTPDPMSQLVYRVHPIPHTLRDFIFDFGSLTPTNEALYISSMVSSKLPFLSSVVRDLVTKLIHTSQQYIRKVERDESSASLRDVKRVLYLFDFFMGFVVFHGDNTQLSIQACSCVLSLSFVYYYRLNRSEDRENFWKTLEFDNSPGFVPLQRDGACKELLEHYQRFISSQVIVEEGIAMNEALMENLFVVILCIFTRIPIFVVGKPGSSKTLTMQVIATNLQGKQSPMEFWREFPAVYVFPYQCSPMSDSHSIQHQFDMAVRYQEHADNTITVLLLDEVGLAEHSPDMPLKVLHAILVDPPIAVVGLSNWVLDPAKMNRAILLQRTEPSQIDIQCTGAGIISHNDTQNLLSSFLPALATAYHSIYTSQHGRDFIGMRDYYCLLKLLRLNVGKCKENQTTEFLPLDPHILSVCLSRNFGGKKDLLNNVLDTFFSKCYGEDAEMRVPQVNELIYCNLLDRSARHLMLLTKNSSALSLMFGSKLIDERTTKVLIGSDFKDDKTELRLVTQIHAVKLAMAEGSTLVLLNHDNIYEALYDVLNQRYLIKKDKQGNIKKMLRLAIGSRSQLCNVADGFKIIVIVEQDHAYRNLDLPLLNRFEKQLFNAEDLLGPRQQKIVDQIIEWTNYILESTGMDSMQEIFCGFHPGTIPSAVLSVSCFDDEMIDDTSVETVKTWLRHTAKPIAVLNSPELHAEEYLANQFCLRSALDTFMFPLGSMKSVLCILLTHSPISHLTEALEDSPLPEQISHFVLQLGELTSERQLIISIQEFLQSSSEGEKLLIIQCDPIVCSAELIHHSRYICSEEHAQYEYNCKIESSPSRRHIIFMIHLPPGAGQHNRHFALDFTHPWSYVFVDDLRTRTDTKTSVVTLLNNSVYDLAVQGEISVENIYKNCFQLALSSCKVPHSNEPISFFDHRMRILHHLLEREETFQEFTRSTIMKILKNVSASYPLSDKENSTKVPIHVRMVFDNLVGGSLRQSLDIAVESLIIQSFAFLLRTIDVNFNLSSFYIPGNEEHSRALWIALFKCNSLISTENWIDSSVGRNASVEPVTVKNTGLFGPAVSHFPFSYLIIQKLNNTATRDQVRKLQLDPQEFLSKICLDLFSADVIRLMDSFVGESGEYMSYLHDFVMTSITPVPGASKEETLQLFELLLRVTRFDSLKSIPGIHACVWKNEERLFRLGNLLANSFIPKNVRKEILLSIASVPLPTASDNHSTIAIDKRLASVDFFVLDNLLENHWRRLHEKTLYDHPSVLFAWMTEFSSASSDIELYLLSLQPFEDQTINKTNLLQNLHKSFLRVKIVHLFVQEVQRELYFSGIKLSCPTKLLEAVNKPKLSSADFFRKLIASWPSCISDKHTEHWVLFLRRYIEEIVFGEQSGFYNIAAGHFADSELLALLELVFDDIKGDLLLLPLHQNLTVRRTFLRCLISVNFPLQLKTSESQQLYLQHLCDDLSDLNINDWSTNNLLQIQDCQQTIPESGGSASQLKSLARLQMCIRAYCIGIENRKEGQSTSSFLFQPLKIALQRNYESKVFALKVFKGIAGIDIIGDLIRSNDKLDWLPVDTSMTTAVRAPDPFVWIFEEKEKYEKLCGVIRFCATRNDSTIADLDILSSYNMQHILAALYTQITQDFDNELIHTSGIALLRSYCENNFSNHGVIFSNWLLDNCPRFRGVIDTKNFAGLCQLQIGIFLGLWASQNPNTWIYALFFSPECHKDSYLISMPDDEFAEIAKIANARGWYACPNGHKYSVGECGMPMQQATCPECGEKIGGANHVSVKGAARLRTNEIVVGSLKPGYRLESNETSCFRFSAVGLRMCRLILHISLLLSSCFSIDNENLISDLLSDSDNTIDPFSFLSARVGEDWKKLRELTKLGNGDLAVAVNIVIRKMLSVKLFSDTSKLTGEWRNAVEAKLSVAIESILCDSKLRSLVVDTRIELEDANATASIRLATGETLWNDIHEKLEKDKETEIFLLPSLPRLLWRFREPVSYQHFLKNWTLQSQRQMAQFPLLQTLIQEESRICNIRGIADVLAWHNVLFRVIPHMSITRTEAIDITNQQVILRLPEEERSEATKILQKFCQTFNKVLPNFEKLYECDDNPFLKNGGVDFGDGKQMDENTCIAFSLPSTVASSDGGNFINGICTLRILEHLVDAQNEVLRVMFDKKQIYPDTEYLGAPQERETPKVPAVSYLTPISVLKRQLIVFERNDFLPLLRTFSEQSLSYQQGADLFYDFKKIENSLRNGLLAGKKPIHLCISHFQYRGDVHLMGQLGKLKSKVLQDAQLSSHIREAIAGEIDTQNHAVCLLQVLELSIQFIVSVGSSNEQILDGDTMLETFVTQTLGLQEKWTNVATQNISQQICLRNIRALYEMIEEIVKGNPLDDIPEKYCEPLTQEEEEILRNSAAAMNIGDLVAGFSDFIKKAIFSGNIAATEELKYYVGCADLEYEDWFCHFPDIFTLAKCKAVYMFYASLNK